MKIWIVNFILAAAILFFSIKATESWRRSEAEEAFDSEGRQDATPYGKKIDMKRRNQLESDYRLIVEKNLFSPDRTENIPEEPPPQNEIRRPPPPGRTVTLFGVIIMEDYRKALVSNPDRISDNREFLWIGENEKIGDLNVLSIEKERILVAQGGKQFEIGLYDKTKPKTRSLQTEQPPRVSNPEVVTVETTPAPSVSPKSTTDTGGKPKGPPPFSDIFKIQRKN